VHLVRAVNAHHQVRLADGHSQATPMSLSLSGTPWHGAFHECQTTVECTCRRKVLHGWCKDAERRRFLSQCARSIWQRSEELVRGQCWAAWRSRSMTSRRRRGIVSHCLARLQKRTVHGAFTGWSESAARQARSLFMAQHHCSVNASRKDLRQQCT